MVPAAGTEGILGVLDEGKLDNILASNVPLIKSIFSRSDATLEGSRGVARRLYDWIDQQTKISLFFSTTRSIDKVKIPGILDTNVRLEEQIKRLEERLLQKENTLVKQFAEMESAISRAQSAGSAIAGFAGR